MAYRINQGAVAEYRCAGELLHRGIIPCWPSTDGRPYDIIADCGHTSYKIQVKGTVKTGDVIDLVFVSKHAGKISRYQKHEVDFIIVYLFQYDTWYVFPIDDVETGVRIKVNDPKCKYRIYHNAWHLLQVQEPD